MGDYPRPAVGDQVSLWPPPPHPAALGTVLEHAGHSEWGREQYRIAYTRREKRGRQWVELDVVDVVSADRLIGVIRRSAEARHAAVA